MLEISCHVSVISHRHQGLPSGSSQHLENLGEHLKAQITEVTAFTFVCLYLLALANLIQHWFYVRLLYLVTQLGSLISVFKYVP